MGIKLQKLIEKNEKLFTISGEVVDVTLIGKPHKIYINSGGDNYRGPEWDNKTVITQMKEKAKDMLEKLINEYKNYKIVDSFCIFSVEHTHHFKQSAETDFDGDLAYPSTIMNYHSWEGIIQFYHITNKS